MDRNTSINKYKKKISVGLRGKMMYLFAVRNKRHLFYLVANQKLGEGLLQKMRRGYKEQGIEGLWLNLRRVIFSRIKKLLYYKRSATKNDILSELNDIKVELRVIRAGQLFLHDEIEKLKSFNEIKNDSSD